MRRWSRTGQTARLMKLMTDELGTCISQWILRLSVDMDMNGFMKMGEGVH